MTCSGITPAPTGTINPSRLTFPNVLVYVGQGIVDRIRLICNLDFPWCVREMFEEINNILILLETSHRLLVNSGSSWWWWVFDIFRIQRGKCCKEFVEWAHSGYRVFSGVRSLCHDSGGLRKKGFGEDTMRRVELLAYLKNVPASIIRGFRLVSLWFPSGPRFFEAYSLQIKPLWMMGNGGNNFSQLDKQIWHWAPCVSRDTPISRYPWSIRSRIMNTSSLFSMVQPHAQIAPRRERDSRVC
jgi:hypothetical protein